MPVEIYGIKVSAPCRILMMTCEALGLDYEFKLVNLAQGDQKKPDYLKVLLVTSGVIFKF